MVTNNTPSFLPETKLVKTRYDHMMRVDPNDYIGRKIIANGAYEHRTIDLLRPILTSLSCRTALDVGANIGNHTLAFSKVCQRIVAFEPGERAYALLSENVGINNLSNVIVVNAGLSEEAGNATLFVNQDGNLGGSTLVHENKGPAALSEEVSLEHGDTFLKTHQIKDVDFIKIDVEGHEQAVLTGLRNTIQNNRPLILMESDRQDRNHQWIDDEDKRRALLSGYHLLALIWNTDKHYWAQKPYGFLRRSFLRTLKPKIRVLTPYHQTNSVQKITDLLLVPDEKRAVVQDYIYE